MHKIAGAGKPQRYEAVTAVTPLPKQIAEYAGAYFSKEIQATYTFLFQGGELVLQRNKAKNITLTPTFADNFWNDQFGYIRFTRNPQGKVDGLLLTSGWIRRMRFVKTSRD